jgi:hypothetical protein
VEEDVEEDMEEDVERMWRRMRRRMRRRLQRRMRRIGGYKDGGDTGSGCTEHQGYGDQIDESMHSIGFSI